MMEKEALPEGDMREEAEGDWVENVGAFPPLLLNLKNDCGRRKHDPIFHLKKSLKCASLLTFVRRT